MRPMQPTLPRLSRRLRYAAAAILLIGSIVGSAAPASAVIVAPTTPMVLQNVTNLDLLANRNGVCTAHFTHVIRNVGKATDARRALDVAAGCHLKVILFFSTVADYSRGTVYPGRVAALVNAVKYHPALSGYLSVKEPSWSGISGSEIRALFSAFRAADPRHPVVGLWGDIPHFGMSSNPYTSGMANIVMVDWYPVETTTGTNTIYLTKGPTYFQAVRRAVLAKTPNAPLWLMVQTHKYLRPATHKKQRPSQALLVRQVREGFAYLGARGIAFHTWTNSNYNIDERRDPTMVGWMNTIAAKVQAGTFQ
jgi:hypothetical protein